MGDGRWCLKSEVYLNPSKLLNSKTRISHLPSLIRHASSSLCFFFFPNPSIAALTFEIVRCNCCCSFSRIYLLFFAAVSKYRLASERWRLNWAASSSRRVINSQNVSFFFIVISRSNSKPIPRLKTLLYLMVAEMRDEELAPMKIGDERWGTLIQIILEKSKNLCFKDSHPSSLISHP